MHACKEIINREVQFKHVKKLLQYILSRACASWHCICMQRAFRFDGNSNTYIHRFTNANKRGKKSKRKQTKEERNIYKRTGGLYVPCSLDGLVESRAEAEPGSSLRMDTTSSTSTYGKINEWIKTMQMTQRYIVWKKQTWKEWGCSLDGLAGSLCEASVSSLFMGASSCKTSV